MATGFHENAQTQPVYFDKGKFPMNGVKKRYIKAPFDMVFMENGEGGTYGHYIVPRNSFTESTSEDEYGCTIFPFNTLEMIVMGENQMGSFMASSDNDINGTWKSTFEMHYV
jgi:hypothetical protein